MTRLTRAEGVVFYCKQIDNLSPRIDVKLVLFRSQRSCGTGYSAQSKLDEVSRGNLSTKVLFAKHESSAFLPFPSSYCLSTASSFVTTRLIVDALVED